MSDFKESCKFISAKNKNKNKKSLVRATELFNTYPPLLDQPEVLCDAGQGIALLQLHDLSKVRPAVRAAER